MKNNPYAQAIDVIADANSYDWRAVATEVAKLAPSVLVRAARAARHGPWEAKVIPLLHHKVEAIKACRNLTGMTLADAKDAVEELQRRNP